MLQLKDRKSGVLILCIGFFVFGLLSTVIGVTIPNIKQEFDISNEQAGLIFVYWSVGTLLGSYVGGRIYHAVRTRTLFTATAVTSIVCLLLLHGEQDLLRYKLYIFIVSLSGSIFFTAGHATAAHVSTSNRASTLSFMDFSVSLGNLSTPFLVNYLVSSDGWVRHDWRLVFVIATALLIVVVGLSLTINLDALDSVRRTSTGEIDHLSALTHPMFIVLMMASLFLHATEWGHSVWFVTYANEVVGLAPEEARETFSLFLIGMALSRLLTSWLTWIFRPMTLMATLISIATVAAVSLSDYQDYYALRVLNFMFGFGTGALFPLLLGLSMDRAPAQAQLLSSAGLMAGTLGAKGASYAIGLVADQSSLGESYRYVSWATVALLASVLAFLSFYSKFPKVKAAPRAPLAASGAAPPGAAQAEPAAAQGDGRGPLVEFEFDVHPPERALGPAARGLLGRLRGALGYLLGDEPPRPGAPRRDDPRYRLLDMELKREFEELFSNRTRLTREEALSFLKDVWSRYPTMKELYPSPAEMVNAVWKDPDPKTTKLPETRTVNAHQVTPGVLRP
ncbi:MFS transporter [Sorangium sp. So ce315]|uniref:MFS transporter n=1 Tax=Sorangium sp. So ce315 TaxID=3133299 RepID=UPI003F5D91E0